MKTVTLNTTFPVSLCCLQDNVSAYPGSRLVVGKIPVFNKKKAARLQWATTAWPTWNCTPLATHCPDAPVPQCPSGGMECADSTECR